MEDTEKTDPGTKPKGKGTRALDLAEELRAKMESAPQSVEVEIAEERHTTLRMLIDRAFTWQFGVFAVVSLVILAGLVSGTFDFGTASAALLEAVGLAPGSPAE